MTTETRLTVAEAAAAYKVSEKTIRRWAKDGVIRSERLGRTVRILLPQQVPASLYPTTED